MEFEQILSLIKAVSDSHLTRFSIDQDGTRIDMETDRTGKVVETVVARTEAPVSSEAAETMQEQAGTNEEEILSGNVVKAPLVGTFYTSASPESDPYVKVGDTVEAGQVLGIVEAMKLMKEIEAEFSGTVTKILVENEQVVEYGQPLFVIE